jgi:hypothetical protein
MKAPAHLPSSLCARFPAFRERARLAAAAGRPGLDWGLPSLNAVLGGAQGMGIVGGIAGARKTTFLQHLGWGVVLNNDAFFAHFTFEMPPEAIDSYAVAHLAGVEKCKALGPLFDEPEFDEQRAALEDALKLVGGRGHTFGVAQAKSVADMREIVEKLRSATKVERGWARGCPSRSLRSGQASTVAGSLGTWSRFRRGPFRRSHRAPCRCACSAGRGEFFCVTCSERARTRRERRAMPLVLRKRIQVQPVGRCGIDRWICYVVGELSEAEQRKARGVLFPVASRVDALKTHTELLKMARQACSESTQDDFLDSLDRRARTKTLGPIFSAFAKEWYDTCVVGAGRRESEIESVKSVIDLHLESAFGKLPLNAIPRAESIATRQRNRLKRTSTTASTRRKPSTITSACCTASSKNPLSTGTSRRIRSPSARG